MRKENIDTGKREAEDRAMPRKGHVMMEAEIGERVEAFLHNLLEGSIFFNITVGLWPPG